MRLYRQSIVARFRRSNEHLSWCANISFVAHDEDQECMEDKQLAAVAGVPQRLHSWHSDPMRRAGQLPPDLDARARCSAMAMGLCSYGFPVRERLSSRSLRVRVECDARARAAAYATCTIPPLRSSKCIEPVIWTFWRPKRPKVVHLAVLRSR